MMRKGSAIGARHITVSTSGFSEQDQRICKTMDYK